MADDSFLKPEVRAGTGSKGYKADYKCAICNKGLWTVSFLDHYIQMVFRLYSTIMGGGKPVRKLFWEMKESKTRY